jgi:hypothetical protein
MHASASASASVSTSRGKYEDKQEDESERQQKHHLVVGSRTYLSALASRQSVSVQERKTTSLASGVWRLAQPAFLKTRVAGDGDLLSRQTPDSTG